MDESFKKIIDESLNEFFENTSLKESSFRVYNPILCPNLWDEFQHLDPRIRVNLLRTAYDFYKKTEFVAPIVDVWLMGSIANYNWTQESDVDVHIIIDFSQLKMPPETASKVAKSAGAAWNKEHNVVVKNHKVEINIQSVKAKKPYVMGIYSLVKDEWIRKPVQVNAQINKPLIQQKYSELKKYVEYAIRSRNREEMKKTKDFLDDYRQYGLDNGGELSIENIVYKILRSKGLVKILKDTITATYDKEMSVNEVERTYRDNMSVDEEEFEEITQKDVSARHPDHTSLNAEKTDYDLSKLTIGNLKALRDKAVRLWKSSIQTEDATATQTYLSMFKFYDTELKKRLSYINTPVIKESDSDYNAWEDFLERRDEQLVDLARLLKASSGKGRVSWNTIPSSLLKKVWYQFGKYKRIKENDIDKIADQILTNIARLQASTEMMGHTERDVRPELVDYGYEFTDEEWENWMSNYFTNDRGGWLLSEYGLAPLQKIYHLIFNAKTPEEKLYACDKALNVVHQRGDLAAMFVEGGISTLNAIADQGGYNSGGEWGDVNREFREDVAEGVGWGNPKDIKKDPLHIPGERWRIKVGKTPKMKEEDTKFVQDLVEQLLMESPEMKTLKKNKKPLTNEERKIVMDAKAIWHMGKDGGPSPAVWKAIVNGKTWYVTNTHRCYQCKPTLKGAIRAYHNGVKQSA